jgi:hypothetical protein
VPNVHAEVLVRKHVSALANDEAAKRPVALTNLKLPTTGVLQFIKSADSNFLLIHRASSFQGATLSSSNMPGIASAVQR